MVAILPSQRRGRADAGAPHHRDTRRFCRMLDFCATHGITADIELVNADQVNEAFERLEKGDVKYRFVVDMSTFK